MTDVRRLVVLLLAASTAAALVALPASAVEADSWPEDCDRPMAVIDAAAPVGVGSCPGVRPGALIRVDRPDLGSGSQAACTLNFRFTGVDEQGVRHAYFGTAGHCAVERGAHVWPLGRGRPVYDARGARIGEVAYAAMTPHRDFALVRIFGGVAVSPEMCHFGGPTGLNEERSSATQWLGHYGQGLGVSAVVPARSSLVDGMRDSHRVHAKGLVVPGDSGGPVIDRRGRAVGVVVTIGVHTSPQLGTVGILRLGPQVRQAEQAIGQHLRMWTAPLR